MDSDCDLEVNSTKKFTTSLYHMSFRCPCVTMSHTILLKYRYMIKFIALVLNN